jgi:hypothetical protein
MLGQILTLVGAVAGGGVVVHLLDRWLYRRRPALDVAKLAQEVAAVAIAQARGALAAAYADASRYRTEAAGLRAELAAARVEIAELKALLKAVRDHTPNVSLNLSMPGPGSGPDLTNGGPS